MAFINLPARRLGLNILKSMLDSLYKHFVEFLSFCSEKHCSSKLPWYSQSPILKSLFLVKYRHTLYCRNNLTNLSSNIIFLFKASTTIHISATPSSRPPNFYLDFPPIPRPGIPSSRRKSSSNHPTHSAAAVAS